MSDPFSRDMMLALEADGELLRQMTGEDHGPYFIADVPQQWFECDACDGAGEIPFAYWGYEPGCGHGHMIDDARPCTKCKGEGGWIGDVVADVKQAGGEQ